MLSFDFRIVSVERSYQDTVKVRVRLDAKVWAKLKKANQLGQLYGIDISNAVSREYGVKAYQPTVADRDNARGGIKWIDLWYNDATWRQAPDNIVRPDFGCKETIMGAALAAQLDNPLCEVIAVDFKNKKRVA